MSLTPTPSPAEVARWHWERVHALDARPLPTAEHHRLIVRHLREIAIAYSRNGHST
jgi:hypothetical protein